MPVAFTSHGYDTTTGNPYTEVAWANAHPSIGAASYGVRGPLEWKVSAVAGQDRTVSIAAGRGWGHGVTDSTFANETIQLDTITSGTRWDLIAVRRDWTPTAGESKFIKVNGGATAVIPGGRVAEPGNIDDQPLALVQVTAGQTQPTVVLDLRTWSGDGGGLVAEHDLVRSFMDAVGTRLRIDGVGWTRAVGDNDTPVWVKEHVPSAMAAGRAGIGIVPANSLAGPFWQAFPADRFTVAPVVTVTTDQSRLISVPGGVTTSGFNLYLQNVTGSSTTANGVVSWTAVQMSAQSATG